MRRPLMLFIAFLSSLLIAGCSSSGHSVDPPAGGVTLVPGDGVITASWSMDPGVQYWLFFASSASISTTNWTTITGSQSVIDASSPYVATGLSNGTVYSFTVNGRTNGGPGGEGTPSVSAVPRLAGTAPALWTAGAALGAGQLRGVAWGTKLFAVGDAGVIYSSPDGVTWNAVASPVVSNLNAALSVGGIYSAVGDGGVILYATDTLNWTATPSSGTLTTNNLYGIGKGIGRIVAVGAGGTIISSTDGTNWAAAASSGTATINDLYAVTSFGAQWVAVGANGTLLTSSDANTWTSVTSNTALDLKGITHGANATTGALLYAAVGASGALVTSPDGVTWTAQTAIGTNTLSAVTSVVHSISETAGTQFIAVGANGSIYTSTDGTTWSSQQSTTGSNLNAIVHAAYSYSAVGASGVNLLAK